MSDVQNEKPKITVDDIEAVRLNIKNVDPAVRHAFTETCNMQCWDRGEVISQLMEQWVRKTWRLGNTADALIDGYRLWKVDQLREEADSSNSVDNSSTVPGNE